MEFPHIPHKSVGPIEFGMNRTQIHSILGHPNSTFRRTLSSVPCDEYTIHSFFVYYDQNDTFEALEAWPGANIKLFGDQLLENSYINIHNYINSIGCETEEDDTGFTCYDLGIGVYAPFKDADPNKKIESVILFEQGYS